MALTTFCSGRTVEGRRCTQKIIGEPEPWFCYLHRAQEGVGKPPIEKKLVPAVWPGYLKKESR